MTRDTRDVESERIVTARLLAGADDSDTLLSLVQDEDLTDATCRHTWQAAQQVRADGVAISSAAIAETLRSLGVARPHHGDLLRLMLDTPASAESARAAVRTLQEARRWRVLLGLADTWRRVYEQGGASIRHLVEQATVDLGALLTEQGAPYERMDEIMLRRVSELDAAAGQPVRRVRTGFGPVDRLTGGLGECELTVIAGATGGGKSALGLNLVTSVACSGRRALVASAEMASWEIADRQLSAASHVPAVNIRDNDMGEAQRAKLREIAASEIWRGVFVLERQGAITVQRVGAVARELQRNGGLDLVVVDYLQLLSASVSHERGRTREAEVSAVARGLKNLAMDLHCPVVALSQLNREAVRAGQEPELHHLRESGEIEQAANTVLFVWELQGDGGTHRHLLCKKARAGAQGRERMVWNSDRVTFRGDAGPMRGTQQAELL